LDECLKFIADFKFTNSDIDYLKSILGISASDDAFFDWLSTIDCSDVVVYAMNHGEIVFAREPLLRISGPLPICQLLETTLLNLVNYPSLIATNASRMRRCAGPAASLLEFGLRRAQGPDGGISAAKYAIVGGFDATSVVAAGKLNNWDRSMVRGTQAHAFVMAYSSLDDLKSTKIMNSANEEVEFVDLVLGFRKTLGYTSTNLGELAAFIAYAQSFPSSTLCLVDTYDTLRSGVPNFIAVALALDAIGFRPEGVRLDSGNLGELSKQVRELFRAADISLNKAVCGGLNIVVSDDIDEEKLKALYRDGHEINTFGIGTHLVTCKKQPALGCVYKLVRIVDNPRIKMSESESKITLPDCKKTFRLYDAANSPIRDIAILDTETDPVPGVVFNMYELVEVTNTYTLTAITPARVEPLLHKVWDRGLTLPIVSIIEARAYCRAGLEKFFHGRVLVDDKDDPHYTLALSPGLFELTETLKIKAKSFNA
jgi:nicotinate phosphoribosyltransferase